MGRISLLDPILAVVPLWVLGIVFIFFCLLAREGGNRLWRWASRRIERVGETGHPDTESQIVAAIFGLLAFVVGLTFSIALDRYDARRMLVVDEANAISTAYLRASLLDEPYKSQIQSTLRDYTRTRISRDGLWGQPMLDQIAKSQELRIKLWDQAHVAILPVRESELGSYFVDAMNEVLNVGVSREVAGQAHVPTRILDVLLIYMLISCAVHGYLLRGTRSPMRQASTVLIVLFTMILVLILDLDRPNAGTIEVPQAPLRQLLTNLDRDAEQQAIRASPGQVLQQPAG